MNSDTDTGEGPQFVGRMAISPTDWLFGVQLEIDSELARMRAVLRSIEDGHYHGTQNRRGNPNLILFQVNDADPERAADQALLDAFQAMMRSYSKYLDALIALGTLRDGVLVDRDLSGEEQITTYVMERIESEAFEVATDRGRPLPAKVRRIGDLPQWLLSIVDGYVSVRNAIEHHHRKLSKDVTLILHRVAIADSKGVESIGIGTHLEKGDSIGAAWLKHELSLKTGTTVKLTEEIVELVAFTLKTRVCPVLLEAVANPHSAATLPEFPSLEVHFIPEASE